MKEEKYNRLALLDILVMKYDSSELGHNVSRKPTHTDKALTV